MTLSITRTNITIQDFSRVSGRSSSRKPILIIGPASSASTLAVNTGRRVTSAQGVVDICGHGPLVEAACDSLVNENRVAIVMRTDATGTAGAYVSVTGTFANASAPTVEGDATTLPEDDLEPGIEFASSGVIGTPGITYRYRTGCSLSPMQSGLLSLGTATSITLPTGAGKYNLVATLATLVARAADIRLKFIAHAAEFGAYHGAVDPASPYTVPTPIDEATLYTACTALRTSALTHVGTVGTTHGAADTTATTAITALSTPATLAEAQAFLIAFASAFFGDGSTVNSGHTLRTTSTIHAAADVTNTLAANTAGVITAGDTIKAITSAPRWSISEIGAALDACLNLPASLDYDGILLCGPVLSKVEADAIAAKVETLRTKARWRRLAPHFRARNEDESLADYAVALEAAYGQVTQRALHGPGVSWYAQSSHPARFGQIDVRPFSFAYFGRLCTVRPDVNPTDETAYGSFARGYVRDPNDPQMILSRAVDDGHTELFTPLRAVAPRTKNQVIESTIYPGQGAMLAPEGSDFYIAPFARIIDEACNVAFRPLEIRLGRKVLEAPNGTIDTNERKRIEAGITQDIEGPLVKTGIAQAVTVLLDPDALINTPSPVVVGATIKVNVGGYIDEWNVNISLS